MNKQCSKCKYWGALDREKSVTGPCPIGIPFPEFWQVCTKFEAEAAPTVAQQSQCRPVDTADPLFFMGVQVVQP